MVSSCRDNLERGFASPFARRSCMPLSKGGWCGCNEGAGVKVPCSTRSPRARRGADVGRHGNGTREEMRVSPGYSKRGRGHNLLHRLPVREDWLPGLTGGRQAWPRSDAAGLRAFGDDMSTQGMTWVAPMRCCCGFTSGASSRGKANSSSQYMHVSTRAMGCASQEGACNSGSLADRSGLGRMALDSMHTGRRGAWNICPVKLREEWPTGLVCDDCADRLQAFASAFGRRVAYKRDSRTWKLLTNPQGQQGHRKRRGGGQWGSGVNRLDDLRIVLDGVRAGDALQALRTKAPPSGTALQGCAWEVPARTRHLRVQHHTAEGLAP